jgi:glycosyltransferase involved in cell wall biosynthesis
VALKVLVLTKYSSQGASSRLRTLQYIPFLKTLRVNFFVQSLFDDRYLNELYTQNRRSFFKVALLYLKRFFVLCTVFRYDVVWLEKEIFPYCPAVFERILAFLRIAYVVDYDDAVFHNYDLSKNCLVRSLLKNKIDTVMKHSFVVTAGNSYLADKARLAGAKKVVYIPTSVNLNHYLISDVSQKSASSSSLIVGWIGSPSTQKYILSIVDVLGWVAERYNVRFRFVGVSSDFLKGLPSSLKTERFSWAEESEVALIRGMDVGIMPLVDGSWERGKCAYKLIQYMACGVPFIASDLGASREIAQGGKVGILANTQQEWMNAFKLLLSNDSLRIQYGVAGRDLVKQKYDTQVNAPVFKQIFDDLQRKLIHQ